MRQTAEGGSEGLGEMLLCPRGKNRQVLKMGTLIYSLCLSFMACLLCQQYFVDRTA
jgi:hypothetical protein